MSSKPTQRKAVPGKSSTDKRFRRGETLGAQNVKKRGRPGSKAEREAAKSSKTEKGSTEPPRKRAREEEEGEEEDIDEEEKETVTALESDEEEFKGISEVTASKKGKRQNRKTGGTGKKQKIFVEEKTDLLNLAASITGQAEEKSKAKLEKMKQKPAPQPRDPKVPKLSAAKQAQLDAARSIVAQRSKQKKDNKKADSAPPPPKIDDGKKRVSFA
ncbi:uncharacterized protein JCM6883_002059 [Sporobolomyces salmoneus]|uniref:uncharacterized protein n=1 Tax=Sporobolomyces salmoneus TaxID=183962 RepID=UPI0031736A4B